MHIKGKEATGDSILPGNRLRRSTSLWTPFLLVMSPPATVSVKSLLVSKLPHLHLCLTALPAFTVAFWRVFRPPPPSALKASPTRCRFFLQQHHVTSGQLLFQLSITVKPSPRTWRLQTTTAVLFLCNVVGSMIGLRWEVVLFLGCGVDTGLECRRWFTHVTGGWCWLPGSSAGAVNEDLVPSRQPLCVACFYGMETEVSEEGNRSF